MNCLTLDYVIDDVKRGSITSPKILPKGQVQNTTQMHREKPSENSFKCFSLATAEDRRGDGLIDQRTSTPELLCHLTCYGKLMLKAVLLGTDRRKRRFSGCSREWFRNLSGSLFLHTPFSAVATCLLIKQSVYLLAKIHYQHKAWDLTCSCQLLSYKNPLQYLTTHHTIWF